MNVLTELSSKMLNKTQLLIPNDSNDNNCKVSLQFHSFSMNLHLKSPQKTNCSLMPIELKSFLKGFFLTFA